MSSVETDEDASDHASERSSDDTQSSSSGTAATAADETVHAIRKKPRRLRTPPGVLDASHRAAMAQWGGRFLKATKEWTYDEAFQPQVEAYLHSLPTARQEEDDDESTDTADDDHDALPTPETTDACTMTERYLFDVPTELRRLLDDFWHT